MTETPIDGSGRRTPAAPAAGGDDRGQTERAVTLEICETIARNDYYRSDPSHPPTDHRTSERNEFHSLRKKIAQLIKAMASSDMDSKQTEAFVTSQMKRRRQHKSTMSNGPTSHEEVAEEEDVIITEKQAAALTEFWMANRTRIHEAMVRRSNGSCTYRSMAWTIHDVPQSLHRQSAPATTAVVQIMLEDEQKPSGTDVIDFRVNGREVKRIVDVLGEIDARLLASTSEL